jgi:hypothetical protein
MRLTFLSVGMIPIKAHNIRHNVIPSPSTFSIVYCYTNVYTKIK